MGKEVIFKCPFLASDSLSIVLDDIYLFTRKKRSKTLRAIELVKPLKNFVLLVLAQKNQDQGQTKHNTIVEVPVENLVLCTDISWGVCLTMRKVRFGISVHILGNPIICNGYRNANAATC